MIEIARLAAALPHAQRRHLSEAVFGIHVFGSGFHHEWRDLIRLGLVKRTRWRITRRVGRAPCHSAGYEATELGRAVFACIDRDVESPGGTLKEPE